MTETCGEDVTFDGMKSEQHGLIRPQVRMFDKDCTGKFKVVDRHDRLLLQNYHIIYQQVKRKKYIFFTETLYVPMSGLITYSSDKAQTILEDVKKLYIPINRAKILAQVLR